MRLIVSRALWVVLGVAYVAYVGGGLSIGGTAFASALRTVALSAPAAALSTSPHVAFDVSNVRDPSKLIRDAPLFWIPDWTGTDRINILLMGVHPREDERAAGIPTRTDTMSVLSIDPVRKNATLISFPRDLWVPIPGLGEQRINEAYPFGELRHLEGGGAGLAERTMEQNFGLHISHYALVNFTGFQELINMVGGVVIDVPRPIVDDAYPTEDYSIQRLYFAPGPQLMDGATALKYARTRHADSDFGRMGRQQQVLLAMRDRVLRQNLLTRLPALVDQGLRAVQTDISPAELLSLGKLASQMDTSALTSLEIQYPLVRDFRGYDGAALLLPDKDAIRATIARTLEQASATPTPATAPAILSQSSESAEAPPASP